MTQICLTQKNVKNLSLLVYRFDKKQNKQKNYYCKTLHRQMFASYDI